MGLFNFSKKSTETSTGPYKGPSTNLIYNLLFCDELDLFKTKSNDADSYPWDILFSETTTIKELDKIINDETIESRIKILACNRKLELGHKPDKKDLFAVIIEVGLEQGLDVLASYKDGTARYINQTGKILIWETTDETSNNLTVDLFSKAQDIINEIGPWDKRRKPAPTQGNSRITFLVSQGLFFGEGGTDVLFNDQMAAPALISATRLMQYLVERSLEK